MLHVHTGSASDTRSSALLSLHPPWRYSGYFRLTQSRSQPRIFSQPESDLIRHLKFLCVCLSVPLHGGYCFHIRHSVLQCFLMSLTWTVLYDIWWHPALTAGSSANIFYATHGFFLPLRLQIPLTHGSFHWHHLIPVDRQPAHCLNLLPLSFWQEVSVSVSLSGCWSALPSYQNAAVSP